ncbi:hypothetical protein KEM55_008892 [Ascosphaera atra]|nr:hypothetical protein KEM55_008892 [Ascosphaera atra]
MDPKGPEPNPGPGPGNPWGRHGPNYGFWNAHHASHRGGALRFIGGATILFFAFAGVKSLFCDRHGEKGGEGHKGPPMMKWRERGLNARDERLREEFRREIEALKGEGKEN